MKKCYLGTNTKMYKTVADTVAYLERLGELTADISRQALELFVIPSFTALDAAGRVARKWNITLGAQNMAWLEEGQLTGEISPLMLREVGAEIAELGHSERRHILGETDDMIRRKVACAARNGLTVLLCVGETGEEKSLGLAAEVLRTQLKVGLHDLTSPNGVWVAYEPVWAIGVNGTPAPASYAAQMHAVIRQTLTECFPKGGADIPILYGGSVRPDNACELIRQPEVDGLFVGRSAWDAERFHELIRSVLKCKE